MGKLYVINDLQQETIIVKEGTGSGSTFLQVKSILPGQQHVVYVDSKATFREFLLVLELPEKLQEKFNSDECLECAEVRITGYNASKLICEKKPKTSRDVSAMTTDANLSNIWQSVLRFFRIVRKRPAPAPQTNQPAVAALNGGSAPTGGRAPTGGSVPTGRSAPDGGSAKLEEAAPDGGSAPDSGSAQPAVAS